MPCPALEKPAFSKRRLQGSILTPWLVECPAPLPTGLSREGETGRDAARDRSHADAPSSSKS